MNEIWKDVVGYEGLYLVSNLGRIKNIRYRHSSKVAGVEGKGSYKSVKGYTFRLTGRIL